MSLKPKSYSMTLQSKQEKIIWVQYQFCTLSVFLTKNNGGNRKSEWSSFLELVNQNNFLFPF